MTNKVRRYTEMSQYDSFLDRYQYLRLGGEVGYTTFGFDRYVGQRFYASQAWKDVRGYVILRDQGCDLGVPGHEINGALLVHHINPIDVDDIVHGDEWILNPEFLICTTHDTHNAIHYGDSSLLQVEFRPRQPGDTTLWGRR